MPKRPEKATVTPIDTVLQAASSASTETVDNDIVHEGLPLFAPISERVA